MQTIRLISLGFDLSMPLEQYQWNPDDLQIRLLHTALYWSISSSCFCPSSRHSRDDSGKVDHLVDRRGATVARRRVPSNAAPGETSESQIESTEP